MTCNYVAITYSNYWGRIPVNLTPYLTLCWSKKRSTTFTFSLTFPDDTVVNWDLFSHAFPKMTASSKRHDGVLLRKNSSNFSRIEPLVGFQQLISSSCSPGLVGKCVKPYPARMERPYESSVQTWTMILGHSNMLVEAKWTSIGWFQTLEAVYCVWLESSPSSNDHDLPHSMYLEDEVRSRGRGGGEIDEEKW